MSFVDITVELFYDGVWNDISADVLNRDGGIRITRGRRDEGSAVDPGVMGLQLRGGRSKVNPAVVGRYSPKNPRSDLFGKIGRYTPIRVRVPSQRAGLLLRNTQDGQASRRVSGAEVTRAYAFAQMNIAAHDPDIRIDLTPAAWNPPHADVLVTRWEPGLSRMAWALTLQGGPSGGFLRLRWWDGTTTQTHNSDVLPALSARHTVRASLLRNDGAGNREVRFWLAADGVAGTFIQHGATQGGAATDVPTALASIEVGSADQGRGSFAGTNPLRGTVHRMQYRSGVGGTVRADPNFETQEPTAASHDGANTEIIRTFSDTFRTWVLHHYAQITNPGIRAHMEMVRWPQRWDTSGQDVWVPAEAGGVMRRLANRQEITQSTMRRHLAADPDVKAYWPCEDGRNSRRLAAVTRATDPLVISGEMTLADFDGFAGSLPLPTLGTGLTLVRGAWVPFHPLGGGQFRGLFAVPATGLTDGATVIFLPVVFSGSSFARIQVVYGTGGSLNMQLRDEEGVTIASSGAVAFGVNGQQFALSLFLIQDGPDIDWSMWVSKVPRLGSTRNEVQTVPASGTFAGQTFGRISRVRVGIDGLASGLSFGHLNVSSASSASLPGAFFESFLGFAGERTSNRFLRLAFEEDATAYVAGDPGVVGRAQFDAQTRETERIGIQPFGGLLDLLQEAADVEHGILYESRDQTALAFQPRLANYRIGPAVALSYTAGHLSPPFFPEDDDRFLTNDVTVSQPDGSSARVQQEDGPLSTQQPPNGIGRGHAITPTLNIVFDQRIGHHANKLLQEGVWDEPRYPVVSVDLRRLVHVKQLPELREALLQLETGSRLDVTDLPEWLPADLARMIVQGYDEQIERERHMIVFNTTPYGPTGQIGIYGSPAVTPAPDAPQRYSPVNTRTTVAFVAGTNTALSVEDQSGRNQLLSQTAGFPLDVVVAGVRLRVTAVGVPVGLVQVLTVQQTPIDGVIKTIPVGSKVELYAPARYAM